MRELSFVVNSQDLEVVQSAEYDAPRERLWRAYTSPRAIPHWWGPARLRTVVDEMDVRPGGSWRFVQTDSDGHEFVFTGTYTEIVEFELLTHTFHYEAMQGELISTAKFEVEDGGSKTKLTVSSSFDKAETLEGMLTSGMEQGAKESMERLAALVEPSESGVNYT